MQEDLLELLTSLHLNHADFHVDFILHHLAVNLPPAPTYARLFLQLACASSATIVSW